MGEVSAVTDLSFALESGTITGFLGPNGASKTTTPRMILGLTRAVERPSAGVRSSLRRVAACGTAGAIGLEAIIHNQAGAVITLLAWGLVVDNLRFGLARSVGRFMPDRASDALMGLRVQHLLSPGAGAITLIAWAVVPGILGIALTSRIAARSSG